MKNQKPLVSVVMPVYNAGGFLVDALQALRAQTYINWELIAVDDASTDTSFKTLKEFAQKDSRIRVFRNKTNRGVSETANVALAKVHGSFIARMDSDDMSFPYRLEKQVKYLLSHPDTVAVGGDLLVVNAYNQAISERKYPTDFAKIYEMMFSSIPVSQPSFMVNKALLPKNFVWYDTQFRVAEEVELLFKLFQYGKLGNIPEPMIRYRVHGNNVSLKNVKQTFYKTVETRFRAIKTYGYRPTVKGIITTLIQLGVVTLLPGFLVYPLFEILRGVKRRVAQIPFPRMEPSLLR